jgi:hypothetical protein
MYKINIKTNNDKYEIFFYTMVSCMFWINLMLTVLDDFGYANMSSSFTHGYWWLLDKVIIYNNMSPKRHRRNSNAEMSKTLILNTDFARCPSIIEQHYCTKFYFYTDRLTILVFLSNSLLTIAVKLFMLFFKPWTVSKFNCMSN